ncbi:MFS transporter, DHA1 family, bicyclomycin/chloramphenicol resistance protein [Flavobacteriaceae bacterium MAR_2010_188]|nr:MFS transporter, DHA1 family, bicyclomycin/chloramphenicol resistance protein [Flavobacteriaceae bacterium MAR_2010_188]
MVQSEKKISKEFVAIMASLMAIGALSIDALLPALPDITRYLGLEDLNRSQQLVTMIFLGLGAGQLIFGPLSDCYGRKKLVYAGFALFAVASLICIYTDNFETMVFGRVLQGIGLSAPSSISVSMVRDQYSGDFMGKILSLIVMIFILVPVVAPSIGQLILKFFDWESIFYFNLICAILVLTWFHFRQSETLPPEKRINFSWSIFTEGAKEFFRHKITVIYTILSGLIMGSFLVYLSSTQQIFEKQYGLGEQFPMIFAILSISIGVSTFFNSQLVMKFGMIKIVRIALFVFILASVAYILLFFGSGNPSAEVLIIFFAIQFMSIGFLFGNLRALAMEPIGHIAGIGAAINGCLSTIMAVPMANYMGSFIENTALPIFVGFTICGILSLVLFLTAQNKSANWESVRLSKRKI